MKLTLLSLFVLTLTSGYGQKHVWPPYKIKEEWREIAAKSVEEYKRAGVDYFKYCQDYNALGDYLNSQHADYTKSGNSIKFDSVGIPKVKYGDRSFIIQSLWPNLH